VVTVVRIRDATASEAASLSRIALESKAHWGYSEDQLRSWRADLAVSPDSIERCPTFVAEAGGVPAGFCQVALGAAEVSLEHLWVRPDFIGHGVGRALLTRALECAREAGFDRLTVDADPNAEPFYAAFGAVRTGTTPAPTDTHPGRFRPTLAIRTTPGDGPGGRPVAGRGPASA
jgi:GNAT superfamily N-acetyltransferase